MLLKSWVWPGRRRRATPVGRGCWGNTACSPHTGGVLGKRGFAETRVLGACLRGDSPGSRAPALVWFPEGSAAQTPRPGRGEPHPTVCEREAPPGLPGARTWLDGRSAVVSEAEEVESRPRAAPLPRRPALAGLLFHLLASVTLLPRLPATPGRPALPWVLATYQPRFPVSAHASCCPAGRPQGQRCPSSSLLPPLRAPTPHAPGRAQPPEVRCLEKKGFLPGCTQAVCVCWELSSPSFPGAHRPPPRISQRLALAATPSPWVTRPPIHRTHGQTVQTVKRPGHRVPGPAGRGESAAHRHSEASLFSVVPMDAVGP